MVIYFGLSGVYQFLTSFIDRDYVFTALPRRASSKTGSTGRPGAVVRSQLPKYSDVYVATVECPRGTVVARLESSIGKYFTEEGEFAESLFLKDVARRILPPVLALDASVAAEVAKLTAERESELDKADEDKKAK